MHNDLNLEHNQIHFINLHLINFVGYEEILSSHPILSDHTPPYVKYPGRLANESQDETVNEECHEYVPPEWRENRCFTGDDHTDLPNHRYVLGHKY